MMHVQRQRRAKYGNRAIGITRQERRFDVTCSSSSPCLVHPKVLHHMEPTTNKNPTNEPEASEFEARVQATQRRLAAELQSSYDFIVCGSGSSGSVVARRLAESDDVSVLLLEAGGTDDLPSVREAGQWLANVGTELDWGFQTAPNRLLNGRRLSLSAGKVLGGSSSINA
jgi:hypothetical protein